MHASERERLILRSIQETGFISYRALEERLPASPATIRRDLARLAETGLLSRVRGGAMLAGSREINSDGQVLHLAGTPFDESLRKRLIHKRAIGRAAAALCRPGEGIMIDGGTTTLQMCAYLDGLTLQVLTNSLHIVSALLPQSGTRILLPAGSVFREQNIILAPLGDGAMPRFHAPKLFMGAASIGPQGLCQADDLLIAAERQFMDRAEEVIVLADSSKFEDPSGTVLCGLDEIDVLVTDVGISDQAREMLASADVKIIAAPLEA